MSDSPIMEGAEPFSADGGRDGVLVLHGFTGNPQSMRPLAQAFAAAGFTVELPLLPGHGTKVEDMLGTGWEDWSAAAEAAYAELTSRCDRVLVAGLSMGGALTCWLASRHPEIVAIVLVNPVVEPVADSFIEVVEGIKATGATVMPGIGSDIAKPGSVEYAYKDTPLDPALSMFAAVADLSTRLSEIRCPVLLFSSPQDHVVPPSNGDFLVEHVAGPVERVTCERSYHVATLDYDAEEIETRSVEFAKKVFAA